MTPESARIADARELARRIVETVAPERQDAVMAECVAALSMALDEEQRKLITEHGLTVAVPG